MATSTSNEGTPVSAANRLGLDYRAEAERLGPPPVPIVDAHLHIHGPEAAELLDEVASCYGVTEFVSQSSIHDATSIRRIFGDRVRFVATPEYMAKDKKHAFTTGFVENLEVWHREYGSKMVKFWGAPRLRDVLTMYDLDPGMAAFDSPWRIEVAERAVELGMMFMVHVADPDTWFKTKYADASVYGTKAQQYESLDNLLGRFDVPCLIAHMGGWPEDLDFLDRLLQRHPRAILDTSATKWMVREISKHDTLRLTGFLDRHRGRILFGSDIVTHDEHLRTSDPAENRYGVHLAASRDQAFELYASRYWALRTMFETAYRGESPIVDPDLAMVDPETFDALSAPELHGHNLGDERLRVLYRGAAEQTLLAWLDGKSTEILTGA